MRIALVNCLNLPEPDIDEQPLLDALAEAGHEAQTAAWDDPAVDWSGFDVAVIRATWNYFEDPAGFTSWIDRISDQTSLLNPPTTLKWNMHKHYLTQLESAGVPIVPSAFVLQNQQMNLVSVCRDQGWTKIVIKPTISAGSFATKSFDLEAGEMENAQVFLHDMLKDRDMMIQRYMPSVDTIGETALIIIDGQLTHAIEKRPRFDHQEEEVYLREEITDEMRAFVKKVLDAAGKEYLYARVDVMPDDDGALILSELEMLEPSLFFPYSSHAVDVFVRGVERFAPVGE